MILYRAALLRRQSRIGGTEMSELIPLGKEYIFDLETLTWGVREYWNLGYRMQRREYMVCTFHLSDPTEVGYLPADCFGLADKVYYARTAR